jgi:hypothetical protein
MDLIQEGKMDWQPVSAFEATCCRTRPWSWGPCRVRGEASQLHSQGRVAVVVEAWGV